MASGVIDFSKWNDMEWWERAGYKSRDEAWADFARAQREFCRASPVYDSVTGRYIGDRKA